MTIWTTAVRAAEARAVFAKAAVARAAAVRAAVARTGGGEGNRGEGGSGTGPVVRPVAACAAPVGAAANATSVMAARAVAVIRATAF